jgi:hypothetical protein
MGYPASAALLFKALTEDKNRLLHDDAKALIKRFSLFAIILADPVKDPIFYDELQKNFSYYNQLTGSKFLFFSIVKDLKSDNSSQENKSFRIFNDPEAYKQDHAAEHIQDSNIAIHAICNVLGIEYDETPCLIVSDNLEFGEYFKLTTNVEKLEQQLALLRSLSENLYSHSSYSQLSGILKKFYKGNAYFREIERLRTDKNSLKILSELLQAISSENIFDDKNLFKFTQELKATIKHSHVIPLKENLIETISLLDCLMIAPKFSNNEEQRTARLIQPDIPKLKNKKIWRFNISKRLSSLKKSSEKEENFKLRKPYDPSIMLKTESRKIHNIGQTLSRDWNNVQASSKNYLKTASIIFNQLNELLEDTEDYSIYTLPLCKSFETEINLSIVQLLRRELGIAMPTYFSKYCPAMNELPVKPSELFVNNPREIPMNRLHNGRWLPPGLGESRLVFNTLRIGKPNLASGWIPDNKISLLVDQWGVIQRVRNLTAHSDSVTKQQTNDLEQSLYQLNNTGLLNNLTTLKSALSN